MRNDKHGMKIGIFVLVLVFLIATPVSADRDIDVDQVQETGEEIAEQALNCASNAASVPVYSQTTPDWGFVLHQNPFGNVYVSWYMTSEMSIGVDEWLLAVYVSNDGGEAHRTWQNSGSKSGTCKYVGNIHTGDFYFEVQGGGMGNQDGSSCTSESWWETTITTEVKVTVSGPSGNVKGEFTFGGHESCTESSLYDSEVVIGESGTTNIPGWLPGDPDE